MADEHKPTIEELESAYQMAMRGTDSSPDTIWTSLGGLRRSIAALPLQDVRPDILAFLLAYIDLRDTQGVVCVTPTSIRFVDQSDFT